MPQEMKGKVALVTGAGSGIGKMAAITLAQAGASVVVSDLNQETVHATAEEIIKAGGQATVHVGDASSEEDVKASVNLAVSTYGGLHAAFNNAGISGVSGSATQITGAQFRKTIEVNLFSVFYGMHYEIPAMLKSGGGSIVNTSSILGLVANSFSLAYSTAKHGVAGMTKSTALAYAKKGIRVNSIHPGYIETPLISTLPQEALDDMVRLTPMGRLGTAEEIADLVLFLLSDRSPFITGAQYAIDGGYLCQ